MCSGVLSSVIQNPDSIFKYQRIQVFFFYQACCVLSLQGLDWCWWEGELQQCPWGLASSAPTGLCTSTLPPAVPLPSLRAQLCFLLPCIWEGASVKKNLKWNTYSGSSILALLKFYIFSLTVFLRFFISGDLSMPRKDSLKECGLCWET